MNHKYKSLRNQITARKRNDEKKWKAKKLDPDQNSCTDTWKTVKGLLGWGGAGPPTQLFYNGRMVTQPAGLASSMNRFFIDKIKHLRDDIPLVDSDPLKKLKEAMKYRQCKFNLKPVNVAGVRKIIRCLKSSSATGVDYIDTQTIKLAEELLAPAITHIINLSISSSTFPSIWKWHKVIPLLKAMSCDRLIPKSYRPVALLPIVSKILEKAVFSQLVKYLEDNCLIHPNLHGSRAGHSTSTALMQMYDTWVEEVEDGKMVGVLLCDQSAAFDLFDHFLLTEKLRLLGLEDDTLIWILSYLSGRRQSCFIDGKLSSPLDLPNCGVPQGSIGGPLLWLVFTCDQPDVVHEHQIDARSSNRGCIQDEGEHEEHDHQLVQPGEHQYQQVHPVEHHDQLVQPGGQGDCGKLVGYVDDGAYSYAHEDPGILSQVLSSKYSLLENWMHANKLVINPDKTHLMVMGSKKHDVKRMQVTLTAGQFTIKPTQTEKLLGGQLHQSLQWNQHLRDHGQSLMKQLTGRINGLRRVCGTASFKTKLMVTNGIFMSKLMYLITLWGGAQEYLLSALQVQQLTAARAVCGFGSWGWSKRKLLDRVGWLSVRQLVFFHTVLQANKIINTGLPKEIYRSLSTKYPYQTRSAASGLIRQEDMVKSSFKYRAMKFFNQVPVSVRTGSQATVKKKLKMWVKTNVPID